MHEFQRLNSVEDASINWVTPAPNGLFFESRLVERENGHYIVYVSSQSGCSQKCKFCHLTQTGQVTNISNAVVEDMREQVLSALLGLKEYIDAGRLVNRLSIAFMARGEPLDRMHFIENFVEFKELVIPRLLENFGLSSVPVKYKISTIFPRNRSKDFLKLTQELYKHVDTTLYWSIYTLDHSFRNRWLPNASDPYLLLPMLGEYYRDTGKLVTHSAWIEGENDGEEQVSELAGFLGDNFPGIRFNHVAYNPYYRQGGAVGKESSHEIIERNNNILKDHGISVKSIKRVGRDVKASCGMFVEKSK